MNAKTDPLLDQLLWESSTASGPSAGTGVPASLPLVPVRESVIRKLSYTHDALIDMMIARPELSQGALALHFGYTQGWLCQVMASDAFRARLAERKDALVDPILRLEIEERLKGMMERSMQILMDQLSGPSATVPYQLAIRALEVSSKAAGFGARQTKVDVNLDVDVHLDTLGGRLTNLLARKRAEIPPTIIDGTCEESPSED